LKQKFVKAGEGPLAAMAWGLFFFGMGKKRKRRITQRASRLAESL
jgi:hypothetical protein